MGQRVASLASWSICIAALTLGISGLALGLQVASDRQDLLLAVSVLGVLSVAYPVAGAFIASRKPENVIGWLLCAAGMSMAVVAFAGAYGLHRRGSVDQLPGADIAAWLASWAFVPALALAAAFLLFLFPTGSPPSRRWWPLVLGVAVGINQPVALTTTNRQIRCEITSR